VRQVVLLFRINHLLAAAAKATSELHRGDICGVLNHCLGALLHFNLGPELFFDLRVGLPVSFNSVGHGLKLRERPAFLILRERLRLLQFLQRLKTRRHALVRVDVEGKSGSEAGRGLNLDAAKSTNLVRTRHQRLNILNRVSELFHGWSEDWHLLRIAMFSQRFLVHQGVLHG
jgi:hypothetical protein